MFTGLSLYIYILYSIYILSGCVEGHRYTKYKRKINDGSKPTPLEKPLIKAVFSFIVLYVSNVLYAIISHVTYAHNT